jgi:hypothetical protein
VTVYVCTCVWVLAIGSTSVQVKALGAYAFSNGDDSFASSHGLQPKLMSEMLSLAQQLQAIIRMYVCVCMLVYVCASVSVSVCVPRSRSCSRSPSNSRPLPACKYKRGQET